MHDALLYKLNAPDIIASSLYLKLNLSLVYKNSHMFEFN